MIYVWKVNQYKPDGNLRVLEVYFGRNRCKCVDLSLIPIGLLDVEHFALLFSFAMLLVLLSIATMVWMRSNIGLVLSMFGTIGDTVEIVVE